MRRVHRVRVSQAIGIIYFCGLFAIAAPPASADAAAAKERKRDDNKTRDITFDDIKFEMEKGAEFKRSLLTKKVEELAGKKIKIRGYILPSFKEKGITQFVLVRDNLECCFGPGAALYDCIVVEMEKGKSTSFTVRPVTVEGRFSIREFKGPDGKHLAIYGMKGTDVD